MPRGRANNADSKKKKKNKPTEEKNDPASYDDSSPAFKAFCSKNWRLGSLNRRTDAEAYKRLWARWQELPNAEKAKYERNRSTRPRVEETDNNSKHNENNGMAEQVKATSQRVTRSRNRETQKEQPKTTPPQGDNGNELQEQKSNIKHNEKDDATNTDSNDNTDPEKQTQGEKTMKRAAPNAQTKPVQRRITRSSVAQLQEQKSNIKHKEKDEATNTDSNDNTDPEKQKQGEKSTKRAASNAQTKPVKPPTTPKRASSR